MIDIITVVFPQELNLLQLQAQSLGLFCSNIDLRSIYVISNTDEDMAPVIDTSWWGPLRKHVKVVPRSVFSTKFVENGWVSQQALKLLAASMSYNPWSMVLDAKTVLVREVQLNQLVDNQGRMQVGHMPIYPVFEPSRQIVNQLWAIDLQRQLGPGGVPFFFHNNTVRSMIAELTSLTGEMFPEFFQCQGRLTEFLLYSGFVESRPGLWNMLYSNHRAFSLINVGREEVENFDYKFKNLPANCLSISVHRDAWPQLTKDQQIQFKNLLIDRGVSKACQL